MFFILLVMLAVSLFVMGITYASEGAFVLALLVGIVAILLAVIPQGEFEEPSQVILSAEEYYLVSAKEAFVISDDHEVLSRPLDEDLYTKALCDVKIYKINGVDTYYLIWGKRHNYWLKPWYDMTYTIEMRRE